jgi:SAM-dependent methyltransferase
MEIAQLWDICLQFEYDRNILVASIAQWISNNRKTVILDAACGTGFPAIDLAKLGFQITCNDGSTSMLQEFCRNAKIAGVTLPPYCMPWKDLKTHFAGRFDILMCRGNSLIYSGAWEEARDVEYASIYESLDSFWNCLKQDGILYVDTTAKKNLISQFPERKTYAERILDGRCIKFSEVVYTDRAQRTHKWIAELTIDGTKYEFERNSLFLSHADLKFLLRKVGFRKVSSVEIPGEHYAVFLGYR